MTILLLTIFMRNAISHFFLSFLSGYPNNSVDIFKFQLVRFRCHDDGSCYVLLLTDGSYRVKLHKPGYYKMWLRIQFDWWHHIKYLLGFLLQKINMKLIFFLFPILILCLQEQCTLLSVVWFFFFLIGFDCIPLPQFIFPFYYWRAFGSFYFSTLWKIRL